jgi:hypothetical protein
MMNVSEIMWQQVIFMRPEEIINTLRTQIENTFNQVFVWLSKDTKLRRFRSNGEFWNIDQIIEHIYLANRYLLILIQKGTKKALQKAHERDVKIELTNYEISNPRLEQIGINNSFEWESPRHMIPKNDKSSFEIKQELHAQQNLILENLLMLKNGEGVLHKIRMSVNSLGRLDVYQYIYFLIKHIRRHLGQMEQIESEHIRKPECSLHNCR